LEFEEGGENCLLHGDNASEVFLSESIGTVPLYGKRNMSIESMYEYGSRAGFWRLHCLFTSHGIPVTVYAVAMAPERHPEAAAAMQEVG
jgi:peptidoglycan/xylan/chitin deacetylase (PgdA/CDA1 family)